MPIRTVNPIKRRYCLNLAMLIDPASKQVTAVLSRHKPAFGRGRTMFHRNLHQSPDFVLPRWNQTKVRVLHPGIQFLRRGHLRQEIAEHSVLVPQYIPSGLELFSLPAEIRNLVLLPNISNAGSAD